MPIEYEIDHAHRLVAYRELESKSTKEVRVFRTLPEALEYLGIPCLEP